MIMLVEFFLIFNFLPSPCMHSTGPRLPPMLKT